MTASHKCLVPGRDVSTGMVRMLLRDETGATTLEYVVAAVALALAAIGASRLIARVLTSYLRHMYLVVTLPVP
jgi:Flp pilus assembly pilin Flp